MFFATFSRLLTFARACGNAGSQSFLRPSATGPLRALAASGDRFIPSPAQASSRGVAGADRRQRIASAAIPPSDRRLGLRTESPRHACHPCSRGVLGRIFRCSATVQGAVLRTLQRVAVMIETVYQGFSRTGKGLRYPYLPSVAEVSLALVVRAARQIYPRGIQSKVVGTARSGPPAASKSSATGFSEDLLFAGAARAPRPRTSDAPIPGQAGRPAWARGPAPRPGRTASGQPAKRSVGQ